MKFITGKVGTLLPAGIKTATEHEDVGGMASTPLGQCIKCLVDGSIDLMVNLCRNQEHGYCGLTGACKTHYGSYNPGDHSLDDILNKANSAPIVGGNPPRQQLCIMDATVGSVPWGGQNSLIPPSQRTDYLVMGTNALVLDFQVIRKIRKEVMKPAVDYDAAQARKFLSKAGYTEKDPQWVEAVSEITAARPAMPLPDNRLSFQVRAGSTVSEHAFDFPAGGRNAQVHIIDIQGRCVRALNVIDGEGVVWDGRAERGFRVPAGNYVARFTCGTHQSSTTVKIL